LTRNIDSNPADEPDGKNCAVLRNSRASMKSIWPAGYTRPLDVSVYSMYILTYIMFGWIIFVVAVWIIVRKKRPDLLGLSEDFNSQRIDGVRYDACPKCEDGLLEPIISSFEKRSIIGLPPGLFFMKGSPDKYRCTNCNYTIQGDLINKGFTRISLAQKLPKGTATKVLIQFGLFIFVMLFVWILFGKLMN